MKQAAHPPSAAERLETLAYRALLAEAEATPKPGLVDRANSGAHADMDIDLFRASAAALRPHFHAFAEQGMAEAALPLTGRFAGIRPPGMDAERAMRQATGGVNTHKGAIFTMGVLLYCCGRMLAQGAACTPEAVCRTAAALVAGVEDELRGATGETHGQRVYLQYGATGIRGEAAQGFPNVLTYALPQLCRRDVPENARVLLALMRLIENVDDTNVLARAGREGAAYCKRAAAAFLAAHGGVDDGFLPALTQLDADFTARNLSPGGCADLVAAAWFLDSVQRGMVG